MADEHLFIVTYDIADARRWRAVFKLMNGYGEWLQLSVFQCRLDRQRQVELRSRPETLLNREEDHVMIIDVGPAESVKPRVHSLGKRGFDPLGRAPVIV